MTVLSGVTLNFVDCLRGSHIVRSYRFLTLNGLYVERRLRGGGVKQGTVSVVVLSPTPYPLPLTLPTIIAVV